MRKEHVANGFNHPMSGLVIFSRTVHQFIQIITFTNFVEPFILEYGPGVLQMSEENTFPFLEILLPLARFQNGAAPLISVYLYELEIPARDCLDDFHYVLQAALASDVLQSDHVEKRALFGNMIVALVFEGRATVEVDNLSEFRCMVEGGIVRVDGSGEGR